MHIVLYGGLKDQLLDILSGCCELTAQFILPLPSLVPPNINCDLSHFGAESQTTVATVYFSLSYGFSSWHCCIAVHIYTGVMSMCHGEWWQRGGLRSLLTLASLGSYSSLPFIKNTHTPSAPGLRVFVHKHRCKCVWQNIYRQLGMLYITQTCPLTGQGRTKRAEIGQKN